MPHGSQPPPPGALRGYGFPAVERTHLDNGIAVWACRLSGRAMVSARLAINAGAITEDVAEAGLGAMTAWGVGEGTENLDSLAFADRRERIAADVGGAVGWESWDINLEVPAAFAGDALALAADALRHPAFREEDVNRIRDLRLNQFRYLHADPDGRAVLATLRQLFSGDSRYAAPVEGRFEVVAGLGPDDLRAYHAERLSATGATLILVGDIAPADAFALAERNFGSWRPAATLPAERPNRSDVERTRVDVFDRPGAAQSVVAASHLSVAWRHPQRPAIDMLGAIVGGLFSSRLNLRLREEKGYTYGARAGFDLRRQGGLFSSATTVETPVTAATLAETMDVLQRTREDGVTQDELRMAIDFELGNWPLGKQATGGIRDALHEMVIHDLPDDHWDRYLEGLSRLTVEEVSVAAREHLHPDRMSVVVVGDADQVTEPLRKLGIGDVAVIDDPPPPEA